MVHGRHEEIIHRVKHMDPQMIKSAAQFETQRQMDTKEHRANINGDQI